MDFTNFITYLYSERYILIPVLYIVGMIIKEGKLLKDKYIPMTLLIIGILMSVLLGGFSIADNIVQGILATGVAVLTNQLLKQRKKVE